jgi:hypothetical protein
MEDLIGSLNMLSLLMLDISQAIPIIKTPVAPQVGKVLWFPNNIQINVKYKGRNEEVRT